MQRSTRVPIAETASVDVGTRGSGFIDGAERSGERTAAEVLATLRSHQPAVLTEAAGA